MSGGSDDPLRRRVLAAHGAGEAVLDEALRATASPFSADAAAQLPPLPLPDEPHLEAWRRYASGAAERGVLAELSRRLVQLRFPVAEGISSSDAYRRATRRGEAPPGDGGLELEDAAGLELELHPSLAGTVPILVAATRADFESLARALTGRNEPVPVPPSMGACLVAGLNNWDRVHDHRRRWQAADPARHTDAAWADEFRRLVPRKELYQDRLIILSRGPYSGVAAADVGVDEGPWLQRSLAIRREHECVHYFTLRAFGRLGHTVLEELVADLVGLQAATGRYDPALARRFLGLESFPPFREGGRLENYRGSPPLSDDAFRVLCGVVREAVRGLGRVAGLDVPTDRLAAALMTLDLEELAAEDAADRVAARLAAIT